VQPLAWYQIVVQVGVCAVIVALAAVGAVPRFRFAALGMAAAVGYGVLQDQVSARLCPEYFTVLHPPVPSLTDPTLLGIAWGFLGTWWFGALMGYVVGLMATVGPRPPLDPRDLVRPVLALVGVVAAVAGLTGLSVWRHVELFDVSLGAGINGLVPRERQRPAFVVACYHFTAYGSAILGSVVLCFWVASERRRRKTGGDGRSGSESPSGEQSSAY